MMYVLSWRLCLHRAVIWLCWYCVCGCVMRLLAWPRPGCTTLYILCWLWPQIEATQPGQGPASSTHSWGWRYPLEGRSLWGDTHWWNGNRAPSQYKRPSFPAMRIPMLRIRRSRDRLIFNMGIPILVRLHPYIETVPWQLLLGLRSWRPIF